MRDAGGGGGGIPGDPEAIRAAARRLASASGDAETALRQVDDGRDTALAGWRGAAADAFEEHLGRLRPLVAHLIDLGAEAAQPLFAYADALAAAQSAYAAAQADAVREHRAAGEAEDGSDEQYQARRAAWEAEQGMRGAQAAAWDANYRAAQQIVALIGHALPPMDNPYAGQSSPPPEPPKQDEDDGWVPDWLHKGLDYAGFIPGAAQCRT